MLLEFTLLNGDYSIYHLKRDSVIPDRLHDTEFLSITRTYEELSIISKDADIMMNAEMNIDRHWRILKVNGPLDLSLTGIIAYISNLFKENNISIFTISTYNTDYILIKDQFLDTAVKALSKAGHKVLSNK